MKRRHKEKKESSFQINFELLNIPQTIIQGYDNADQTDKVEYLSKIICESSRESCSSLLKAMWDQSKFFMYQSSTHSTSELFKWSVYQLLQLTKEFDDSIDYDNDEKRDIVMSNDLFLSLISEAYESNDLSVKNTALEVLLNYSKVSKTLNNYFIIDLKFLHLLFKLTYINSIEIIRTVILLIHNILYDNLNKMQHVLNSIPIHVRMAELLKSDDIKTKEAKCDILLLVNIITKYYPKEELYDPFNTFIFVIHHLFIKNEIRNESLFEKCLDVLIELSFNENLSVLIISTGIGVLLLQYLSQKQAQNDYVYKITLIIGNLLFSEEIVDYLLKNNILDIFQRIINTYTNSCNKNDNEILIKTVFALCNISGGTHDQNRRLFNTKIPNSLKMMCKHKSDIRLTKEVIIFYQNAIQNSDNELFVHLLQSQVIQFFCEQLYRTGTNDIIMLCLNCIRAIITKMNDLYKIYENIKNDLIKYGGTKKIEELIMNKNQDISLIAYDIVRMLDSVEKKLELE